MAIKKAVIFTNGDFSVNEWSKKMAENADYVIAADGGARHAIALGVKVDELIGDMDSVTCSDSQKLKAEGAEILVYPEDKDKTDLELALDSAIRHKAEEIHILAGAGGRFDHVMGNGLLSAARKYIDKEIWFYSNGQRSIALGPDSDREFETRAGSIISVIPLSARVCDFFIEGVKWPLWDVELELGSTFTISNQSTENKIRIRFSQGVVMLILGDVA